MSPQKFLPASYDTNRLAALQDVYDTAWGLLRLQYPDRTRAEEEELQAHLARSIAALAEAGITDQAELFRLGLMELHSTMNGRPKA